MCRESCKTALDDKSRNTFGTFLGRGFAYTTNVEAEGPLVILSE